MKIKEFNTIINKVLTEEVKQRIIEDIDKKEVYHIMCDGEPIDSFESKEEANSHLDKYKKEHPGKQLIIEPSVYESYEDMIDKLGEMGEELNMKNKLKESKKSIVVTESQMKKIIKSLVNENVPGIEVTKRAQAQSKKDADENLKNVNNKLKKAASFNGNDNPEFPKPIGKGEKVAIYNTDEENEYVDDYRGGGMQDIIYDEDPGEQFKKRQKMSLEGDKLMGNSQDAGNVVKSDLGKKIVKNAVRKAEKIEKDPMYVKDDQPVDKGKPNNEKPSRKERNGLSEDIQRIKNMYSYNKKTQ